MSDSTTTKKTIARGEPNEKGWVNLEVRGGEALLGQAPSSQATPILSLIHLSDTHICDAQSPLRFDVVDRLADPHNPTSAFIPFVGGYRANEIMTTQTLETMVRTVNGIKTGFVSERPIDAVVLTGDVTDNAQANELDWYMTLMDGGTLHPDSGDTSTWEGGAQSDPAFYERSYWNPEGTPPGCEDDFPRSLYGLPTIPGLLDAVRKPFEATGFSHPWLAVHGNHDALFQGTMPVEGSAKALAFSEKRIMALAPDLNLQDAVSSWNMVGPADFSVPTHGTFKPQQADERRRFNGASDWADIHRSCGRAGHDGHGLTEENSLNGTKFWSKMIGDVKIISLDTVNINGGWMGSLDRTQFEWMKRELADSAPKYFVLLSHHALHCLFNDYAPEGADGRVAVDEVKEELLSHPRIILWLAGHDHDNRITFVGEEGAAGFWQVQTASLIDWPQQGRIVEILEDEGRVVIATSVIDHESPIDLDMATSDIEEPSNLAGISRILSANHWHRRQRNDFYVELASGEPEDRNRYLWL